MALTDGIIGCWSPSIRGSGYLLPDLTGRGNHGTLINMDAGTDWQGAAINGVSGNVLDFDGNNDQIVTRLSLPAVSSRTISMWVRARSLNSWAFGTNFGVAGSGLFIGTDINLLTVTQFGGAIRDAVAFPTNSWQHICATHIGNDYRLFRNGSLVNSGTMTTTPVAAVGYLGSYGNGGYWNGQIGESVFFAKSVTDAEVAEIYRLGNGAIGRQLTGQTRRRVYGFVAATGARRRRILTGMV